jgi:hypothetical protein
MHQNLAIHQLKGNMKTVGQEVRRKQSGANVRINNLPTLSAT